MNEMNDHSNPATPLMSKSVSKRLAVQKPEQTEDEKIREAFEKEDLSSFMIRDRPVQNRNEKVRLFRGYNLCYKSRQQEIERMKCCGNCDNYDICMFSGDHHCINWTIKESE